MTYKALPYLLATSLLNNALHPKGDCDEHNHSFALLHDLGDIDADNQDCFHATSFGCWHTSDGSRRLQPFFYDGILVSGGADSLCYGRPLVSGGRVNA